MGFLAMILGPLMSILYQMIPNFAVTMIVFTVIIKLLMLPLMIKQQKSMAKMSVFTPMINEIQQKYPTAMVFYGQDTGYKLQKSHDELGVLLPLKEFEHNILHHLEQVDGIVLRCREEMIHQAGKDSLPL